MMAAFWRTVTAWTRKSPAAQETAFLLGVDTAANVVDYGFHIFLGRVLLPGEFAVVQTLNAALMIISAAFGVSQPVVARHAASIATNDVQQRAAFRYFFQISLLLGLGLGLTGWLAQASFARWLNVPPLLFRLFLAVIPLALVRPVVAGLLQGQQRMIAFGLTRAVHAVTRLLAAALLIQFGSGLTGVVIAFPVAGLLALGMGLAAVGRDVWRPAPALSPSAKTEGWRLAGRALAAYTAYMILLNNDLIWVNRVFSGEAAGSYATAVLLRRVLALMPGVLIVIMYPRAVARVARAEMPDTLLIRTSLVVIGSTLALTLLYARFGATIIRLGFGSSFTQEPLSQAAPLLGWMGLAMMGYGLASIWLNFYLAISPADQPQFFVWLLCAAAILQHLLLSWFHQSLWQVTLIFMLTGWALALGGLVIYRFVLRPRLHSMTLAQPPIVSGNLS